MIRLPENITEAELLALMEGEEGMLTPERREVVRAAVARDAALSRVVLESRGDASALVQMSRVCAPASVRARVIEELRRPVRRLERVLEPEGGRIPISTVVVDRPTGFQRFLERLPVRQLAAAASLALVSGIGVWVVVVAVRSASRTAPRLVAINSDAPPPPVLRADQSPGYESLDIKPGADLALNLPEPGTMVSGPILVDEYGFAATLSSPPQPAAASADIAASPDALSPAAAVAMAREGRLVIRVRAADAEKAATSIREVAAGSMKELNWRPLEAWELPGVSVALRLRAPGSAPVAGEKGPPAAAQGVRPPHPGTPDPQVVKPFGTDADIAGALAAQTDYRALFTVEMSGTEHDLGVLLSSLTTGSGQVAEFVALEEPLPTLSPSTDPSAVLWWTRPPSEWTRRVCVPVVLESGH